MHHLRQVGQAQKKKKAQTSSDFVIKAIVQIFRKNSCSEPLECFSFRSSTPALFHFHTSYDRNTVFERQGFIITAIPCDEQFSKRNK